MKSIHPDDLESYIELIEKYHKNGKPYVCKYRILQKNKTIRWIHERGYPVPHLSNGEQLMTGVCTDITEQQLSEKSLADKTKKLEERNIALNVLLENRDEDKKRTTEMLLKNFENLVFPYYEKIRDCRNKDDMLTYLDIIIKNTHESLEQIEKSAVSIYRTFTPMEIQVSDLIKTGKTSKEIAGFLNIGTRSVFFHRNNIRKKLGIHQKKTNLRSILLSQH
jgi:DNA-binding CsgD family transcriptional regulator